MIKFEAARIHFSNDVFVAVAFVVVKVPILSKATVKRAAKTCNVFCNITAKQVEKRCCAFFAHV